MSQHGTRTWYNGGCRCDLCKQAAAAYQVRYRAQTRPNTRIRTLREVRDALRASGYGSAAALVSALLTAEGVDA